MAFDIQKLALERTKERLDRYQYKAELILKSHVQMGLLKKQHRFHFDKPAALLLKRPILHRLDQLQIPPLHFLLHKESILWIIR